jgi:hypothetical protein
MGSDGGGRPRLERSSTPMTCLSGWSSRRSTPAPTMRLPGPPPWIIADGALRTLSFAGDFAAVRTLTEQRLRLADKVQV